MSLRLISSQSSFILHEICMKRHFKQRRTKTDVAQCEVGYAGASMALPLFLRIAWSLDTFINIYLLFATALMDILL